MTTLMDEMRILANASVVAEDAKKDVLKDAGSLQKIAANVAAFVKAGQYKDASDALKYLKTSFIPTMIDQLSTLK